MGRKAREQCVSWHLLNGCSSGAGRMLDANQRALQTPSLQQGRTQELSDGKDLHTS